MCVSLQARKGYCKVTEQRENEERSALSGSTHTHTRTNQNQIRQGNKTFSAFILLVRVFSKKRRQKNEGKEAKERATTMALETRKEQKCSHHKKKRERNGE